MKHLMYSVAAVAFAIFTLSTARGQAPELDKMDTVQRALPDGPVALVDGKPVTKDDFLFLYKSQLARMHLASGGKSLGKDVRVKAGIGTLAELIQREILGQLAARRNLQVGQAEVKEAYDNQLKLLIEEFTIDGVVPTEEEILRRSGQTRQGALEDMHKALLVEKASQLLAKEKGLSISDKEAREFYDQNAARFQRPGLLHLKQIFTRAVGEDKKGAAEWDKAEKAIKKAHGRFLVGETFDGIAKSMSDGRDKEQGGDMGMRPTETIPPIYVEKSKSMEIGETSEPFKSDQGWHFIQLVAREGASDVPFDEAKEWIKDRLNQVKIAAAVEEFCQPIVEDVSRVQIFLQLRVSENKTSDNS